MPAPLSDFQRIQETPEQTNLRTMLEQTPGLRPQGPMPLDDAGERAMARLRDMGGRMGLQSEAEKVPGVIHKATVKTDPESGKRTMIMEGDADAFETTMKNSANWQQALGGMAQHIAKMEEQTRQREEYARQHPWMQLATALSANLAQAKDMPGWVQAAGRTAAQLNPTADELRNQRMAMIKEQADIAGKGGTLAEAQLRTEHAIRMEKLQSERAARTEAGKTFHDLGMAAQKGELTDVGATSEILQSGGVPKGAADARAKALVGISQEKQRLLQEAEKAKDDRERVRLTEQAREADNRLRVMLAGITAKASEKSDADKALDATAKSLAAGDLSAIRDVSSFRGTDRMKLYARAKEINPEFSTSELNRKIKMLESFEVGKDRLQLQSFGTFLEHGGEAAEALKGISLSNTPAFNKPMNWWREHMAGSPELTRLLTAIEPVGKEFFGFLLGGKALYADDRERIKMLMNSDQSPKQIMAALQQAGKTAKDRVNEMNYSFKRVMKTDIPDPFSPEAIIGAKKIGIDLGVGSPETEPKGTTKGRTKSGVNWEVVGQ